MIRSIGLSMLATALASAALAGGTQGLVIFDKHYRVDRFDYVAEVTWPDPLGGPDIFPVGTEGAQFLTGNRLLLATGDGSDIGTVKNFVIEVEILYAGAFPTGLQYVRTVVQRDFNPLDPDDYDIDPSGVSLNTGSNGLGAGGQVLIADAYNEDGTPFQIRGYDLASGAQLEWPSGSGCLGLLDGKNCGIPLPDSVEPEDLEYIQSIDRIFVLPDDIYVIEVYDPNGTHYPADAFPFGQAAGYPDAGEGKGITYLPPSAKWPSVLQFPNGAVIVTLDDGGPGLHAFDTLGNDLGVAWLTDTGTPTGTSLLDLDTCGNQLQLESAAADAATGRLFLVNQSDDDACGFLWVLTPTCRADFDLDFDVDQSDLGVLLADFGCDTPPCSGDVDGDGDTDQSDLGVLLAEFGSTCD
jgi:hypothetical protein